MNDCQVILQEISDQVEDLLLLQSSSKNESVNDLSMNTVDYLSLQPEKIVSITRSRTSTHELEFLLKCQRYPTRLFFISNEKAKELIPNLLIEFYERHINWFIDRRKI